MNERLMRSRDDRMLAGVAGGLAELWDADPAIIRLAWIFLAVLTGGIALVVYIVMAIVVPEADEAPWAAGPIPTPAPAPGSAAGPGPAEMPGPATWAPPLDSRSARRAARAARRAERRARRASDWPLLLGGFLVIIGAMLLVRQWLPQFDSDVFGPTLLILFGVLLLATAIRRGPDARPPSTGTQSGDPQGAS
jgi:phage shock protein C